MSFLENQFRSYFLGQGLKESSCNSYLVNLRKLDSALREKERSGLDEAIAQDVLWVTQWATAETGPPFDKEASNRRSALTKYLLFRQSIGDISPESSELATVSEMPLEPTGQAFHLERDMQLAVRRQIENLETGLRIVDNNVERRVNTGEVDIVAKDANDIYVVVELKAGDCPRGALEQLMAYANDVRIEEGVELVRMFLIARSFSNRIIGAASFVPNLKLVTYDFFLKFSSLELNGPK